ncbi:head-tail connector protein [Liquorilactobacillus nagelii]|uniref:head-tail connector protein n=1 Tax=Liquorilactobacillus nagelii TaxID=82688 RepID=UPI0039ECB0D4
MAVDTNKFKGAFHVDGTDDDPLIAGYISTASSFVQNAVGEDTDGKFYSDSRVSTLFDTAVLSLAGTYYQYRLALSDVQTYSVDLTVNSIIGQLRGLYDLIEGDVDAT